MTPKTPFERVTERAAVIRRANGGEYVTPDDMAGAMVVIEDMVAAVERLSDRVGVLHDALDELAAASSLIVKSLQHDGDWQ